MTSSANNSTTPSSSPSDLDSKHLAKNRKNDSDPDPDSDLMPSTAISPTPSSTHVSCSVASTSSQPPSISTDTRWDVFLCFRGMDTRKNFTSYLYDKLVCNGIKTFMDDPQLPRGSKISEKLIQAIHESKACIVVFSQKYASSPWCLDELVEILNCKKTMQKLVIPVFYNIDPSTVRRQTGSFKQAFEKHEHRSAGEMERVQNWRLALKEAAGISGYDTSESRSEADIISKILHDLFIQINPRALYVAKYPVGLEARVKRLIPLLSNDEKCVIRIGIYGMGGVGKTTLAKALYNELLLGGNFEGSSFVANVREVSESTKGLASLQEQIINDVLESREQVKVNTVEEGTMLILNRLRLAKVLLLIDDIPNKEQYESLVGPFASGSVVIITTRDEGVLNKIEPTYRYRVNELDDAESLELFKKHTFGDAEAEPNETLKELTEDILRLASGLPMALEVFGSHLFKQSVEGWTAFIKTMQRKPNSDIQEKLMVSLNALARDDPMLKKIFIDIACLFIGRDKEEVVKILETYYSDVNHKIDTLKEKCLLTINNKYELRMHDVLQDMGREIARNNSHDEPGKYSRLWASKDIYDVLKKRKGTKAIECIISSNFICEDVPEGVSFASETFRKMSKLRFLQLYLVNITGNFEQTFEDLRWLCWVCCPLKFFPSKFYPEELVILELPYSKLRTMWEVNMVTHVFKNLKTLNMSNSQDLSTTPDFTKFPCLETLNLKGCKSLEEVHISIGSLAKLVFFDLHGCVKLRNLPDTICKLRALEVLTIDQCSSLGALPLELGNIESLTVLSAQQINISSLPDSIGRLSKLVKLRLQDCKNLETLPETVGNLRSLEIINLSGCEKLEILPDQLWKITSLWELDARGAIMLKKLPDIKSSQIAFSLHKLYLSISAITTLPSGINQLYNLEHLDIIECWDLLSIAELPPNLKYISAYGCMSLKSLPNLSNLRELETLELANCSSLTKIQGLEELTSIRRLHLGGCNSSLADTFTKRFFQIYSEFGHHIEICAPEFPDWLMQSRYLVSESSENVSTISLGLLPNMSHSFMGVMICCKSLKNRWSHRIGFSLKTTDSNFVWSDKRDFLLTFKSLMVVIPKSIFSVKDNDDRIEVTAHIGNILQIHLLYKTDRLNCSLYTCNLLFLHESG